MSKDQVLLAIDTSTATMAGAITKGNHVLAEVQTEAERNHSIHIMTNIEKMMDHSKVALQEVSAFVTGIGPGSYTGVRIAVTAVKTLAWTTKKPVIGISSLEALAYGAILTEEQEEAHPTSVLVVPIMDARRGQVYTSSFEVKEDGEWNRKAVDQIVMMNDWCQHIAKEYLQKSQDETVSQDESITQDDTVSQQYPGQVWIVGDVHLHEGSIEELRTQLGAKDIVVRALQNSMYGLAIAKLGEKKLASMNEEQLLAAHDLVPNYAQLTEAEVKQNAKEKKEG